MERGSHGRLVVVSMEDKDKYAEMIRKMAEIVGDKRDLGALHS